jgi:hypothetical protein
VPNGDGILESWKSTYTPAYTTYKKDTSPDKKHAALNRYRSKLFRLQARRTEYQRLETSERDMFDGEETTLYHLIKSTKRCEARMTLRTQDQRGGITEVPTEIAQIFVAHLKDKYSPIDVSVSCVVEMPNAIRPNTPPSYANYLEQPITAENFTPPLNPEDPTKSQGQTSLVGNFIYGYGILYVTICLDYESDVHTQLYDASSTA